MDIKISEKFTKKKLIQFTFPTIAMMICTSIYGVVDGIFVSNCSGVDAFSAVNLIMPFIMIFGALGFMAGTGGSAYVSMTIGMGRKDDANRYFSMLIYFLIITGAIFSVIGITILPMVAEIMGAEGAILENCIIYGRIILLAIIPFVLQNSFQSFIIVAEKPKFGLIISIFAGLTNIVMDFLLVYMLKMGVAGAAIATVLSQLIGCIIPLIYFARKNKSPLRLVKTKLEFKPIWKSCINGSSEMMTTLSMSIVNMLYNVQLMKYAGSNGVAAYGVIMYSAFIFVGTYVGYSIGVTPVIGYNYGANNHKELKKLLKNSLIIIGVISLLLTTTGELLSKSLAGIFVSYDDELFNMTCSAIRIYFISFIISGFNIFGSAFFTGLNNGFVSAIISFLRTFLFQIVTIFILPEIMGINGIWLSIVVAEALALIVTIFCFVKNKKKYNY